METRKALCLMVLVFSVALLVQYLELPYGYVLSSLLALGKSQVRYMSSSLMSKGSSNDTRNLVNQMAINGMNATKLSPAKNILKTNNFSDAKNVKGVHDMKLELTKPSNHTVNIGNERGVVSGTNHGLADERVVRNKSWTLEKSRKAGPELPVTSGGSLSRSSDKDNYHANNTDENSSIVKNLTTKSRIKGPPSVVVPISTMNEMLHQSLVSYRNLKPQWPVPADQELADARKSIDNAQFLEKNPHVDVDVYRNYSKFIRSYEMMEKTLKIYIYTEGEKPVFHNPELYGIYASEGWFMKQLEENKHFITKDPNKAHLYYLPFSSHLLEETLYVPNSHSRKNLVQYLSSYLQNITTKHRFWNRTSGSDHFLVACHDWAPAETSRIMKNCIRSLCNADAKGGFQFNKDVSLPETYVRYPQNPLKNLGGKSPSQRKTLAFFAGKMHGYLRPILLKHWENKDPDMKISGKLAKNEKGGGQMTYTHYMKSSKYCLSTKGYEAYTPRVVEAIFYECVPVIISDNYVPPFFETLNWESFAVFILEKDIPNLKKILLSIPEEKYVKMQNRVRQVQKHFLWHLSPVKFDVFHMILHSLWRTRVSQMSPG